MEKSKQLPERDEGWKSGDPPHVDLGGTLGGMGLDRSPVTVRFVEHDGRAIWVSRDDYVRIDKNGMSECQSYDFFPGQYHDIRAGWTCYTLRKDGSFVREGDPFRGGQRCHLGFRQRWYNFSF